MAYVRDILNITNLITQIPEITHDYVEADITLGMSNVRMVVDCWAAHIHVDAAFIERGKNFFFFR
jgi:hypothetical protein